MLHYVTWFVGCFFLQLHIRKVFCIRCYFNWAEAHRKPFPFYFKQKVSGYFVSAGDILGGLALFLESLCNFLYLNYFFVCLKNTRIQSTANLFFINEGCRWDEWERAQWETNLCWPGSEKGGKTDGAEAQVWTNEAGQDHQIPGSVSIQED